MNEGTFRPCVIVPCYNHGSCLSALAAQLESQGLPAIFVNDGSTDETDDVVCGLIAKYPWLTVLRRPSNGGKGAAVCEGIRWANDRKYTHAVCVDADGQHAIGDVPLFLDAARRAPHSLILGAPHFGPDAPLVRRLGREISNVLTVVATWRFAARDVLCGFRVYPVREVLRIIDGAHVHPRMGFDMEIIVRALWAGLTVRNIPTAVVYPSDGVSHFRYGADNMKMFALFSRLIAQGVVRGPLALTRRLRESARGEWYHDAERGSANGLRFLQFVLEKIGRGPLLVCMAPVVFYMFVFGRASRRAAMEFQRHVALECGESVSTFRLFARALQQHWEFAISIVEKVVSWREGLPLERFTWTGRDEVRAHLAKGQGVIFLGGHVGNIEVIRALGESRKIIVNALMFTAHARHFKGFLEEVNKSSFLRVIDVSTVDTSLILELEKRVENGEIIAVLADRVPKHSAKRVVEARFLGGVAVFPEGPWLLCSFINAPVFTAFSMREPDGRYSVEFERFAERIELPREGRREAIRHYAQLFADRLARIAQRYPCQWFNFYPYWSRPPATPVDPTEHRSAA